jgi:hypothetical protein
MTDYRALVDDVFARGCHEPVLALVDGYAPVVDEARVERDSAVAAAELAGSPLRLDAGSVASVVALRCVCLPTPDDALGLAISRLFVHLTALDDAVTSGTTDPLEALEALHAGTRTPLAALLDHALGELSRFCDRAFSATLRAIVAGALYGVHLERCTDPDLVDGADVEHTRLRSGCAEVFALPLCLVEPGLGPLTGRGFLTSALPSALPLFINGVNDLLSCHKESLDEADFALSALHRRATATGVPYRVAYEQEVARVTAAHDRLLAMAPPRHRPVVENYLKGYVHVHRHAPRYGLADVVAAPG